MNLMSFVRIFAVTTVGLTLISCSGMQNKTESQIAAKAELQSTEKTELDGEISFLETDHGVKVVARVSGLKPDSVHGLHIHENGKCDAPDFKSAGGHFNPEDQPHGAPSAQNRHVGDFGNIVADSKGVAVKELLLHKIDFEGDNSVVGKAIILHAEPDDLESQPSGDAGGRMACGIIQSSL